LALSCGRASHTETIPVQGVPKSVAPPPGMNADYNTYAQTKQQEATEAVKASVSIDWLDASLS